MKSAAINRTLPILCALVLICIFSGCDSSDSKSDPTSPESSTATTVAEPQATQSPDKVSQSQTKIQLVDSRYVSDKQCAECHEEIWNSYQSVGMAQSAYEFDAKKTIEDFENAHFYHELSQKHYEMAIEDGKFVMTRYRLGKDDQRINEHKKIADFIIGSGNHSRTYCYREPSGAMFQMPVVWYSQTKTWGMAPGYDKAEHDDFKRQITRECMFCHNAYPEYETGSDSFLAPASFPKTLPHGIGCQRCHGPGEAHVKAAEKDPESAEVLTSIVNSSKLPPQQRDDVCNQCHLQPTSSRTSFLRHFDRGAYSFRPGERLSDYQAYAELADAKETDLFEVNHHSYRMQQSKCFTNSDGALNCVSCHDPHAKVAKEDQVSFYQKKCFQCHGNDECLDMERGRQSDSNCVECHMPTRRTEDVIQVTMTDHKIVRSAGGRDLLAPLKEVVRSPQHPVKRYDWRDADSDAKNAERAELSEILMRLIDKDSNSLGPAQSKITTGDAADESKATLAQALLENGRAVEALKLLNDISPAGKRNSSVQSNLGLGLIQQQNFALAARFLEKAVELKPVVPEAHFNLGIAYINSGRIDDAIGQFRKATTLQPSLAKAGFYLSAALARNEQYGLAEQEIKRVIQIEPNYPGAVLMLSGLHRYQENRSEAIAVLENEKILRPKDGAIAEELAYLSLESVSNSEAAPRVSLEAAKSLFRLTQTERNSRLILAVALVQNGYNDKALEAVGSLGQSKLPPEKLLIAAVAKANLDEKDAAAKLYRRGKGELAKVPEPHSRLLKIASQLAASAFETADESKK